MSVSTSGGMVSSTPREPRTRRATTATTVHGRRPEKRISRAKPRSNGTSGRNATRHQPKAEAKGLRDAEDLLRDDPGALAPRPGRRVQPARDGPRVHGGAYPIAPADAGLWKSTKVPRSVCRSMSGILAGSGVKLSIFW